jgi:exodeoxyribonuclease V gamma subunit
VSYTGRHIRDNAVLSPSVLVSDLQDSVVPAITPQPASESAVEASRHRLTVVHPLQAFSTRYFVPDAEWRLVSYDEEYCAALKAQLASRTARNSVPDRITFVRGELADPEPEWRLIGLDRLRSFFHNPCRYFLRERLGLRMPEAEDELEDAEPFVVELPDRSAMARRLLPVLLAAQAATDIAAIARAGVEYPPGSYGARLLDAELRALTGFAAALRRDLHEPTLRAVNGEIDFEIDGEVWRLEGGFGDLRATGLVRNRYDDVRARDYLFGWIDHLFLCALAPAGVELRTRWHSRDGCYTLAPVTNARELLHDLVDLYASGLREPVHFFPKSAWCYAAGREDLEAARKKWTKSHGPFAGEDGDAAYRLCLRGEGDALDGRFQRCAMRVYGPLLDAIDDPRLQ